MGLSMITWTALHSCCPYYAWPTCCRVVVANVVAKDAAFRLRCLDGVSCALDITNSSFSNTQLIASMLSLQEQLEQLFAPLEPDDKRPPALDAYQTRAVLQPPSVFQLQSTGPSPFSVSVQYSSFKDATGAALVVSGPYNALQGQDGSPMLTPSNTSAPATFQYNAQQLGRLSVHGSAFEGFSTGAPAIWVHGLDTVWLEQSTWTNNTGAVAVHDAFSLVTLKACNFSHNTVYSSRLDTYGVFLSNPSAEVVRIGLRPFRAEGEARAYISDCNFFANEGLGSGMVQIIQVRASTLCGCFCSACLLVAVQCTVCGQPLERTHACFFVHASTTLRWIDTLRQPHPAVRHPRHGMHARLELCIHIHSLHHLGTH